MIEGWMAVDRLAALAVSVANNPNRLFGGGVQPLGVGSRCPPGFPIKHVVSGRNFDQHLVVSPEYWGYDGFTPSSCYRTLEEAAAWGFSRTPNDPPRPSYETPTLTP